MQRKIIHIDMDCFFAAVEVRDHAEYVGRPLAVGGDPSRRGVIATANYEARKFGVRSAMSSAKAMQLCPQLLIVRGRYEQYKIESLKIRSIFKKYTDLVEPLSLDEAFLDVSKSLEFSGSATLIAQKIREEIFSNCQLTASAGIASNKFLAKIASEWRKPNGQFTIRPQDVDAFISRLPVEKIFGVGKVTAKKMKKIGIHNCKDLQTYSKYELSNLFGKWGVSLYDLSRGIDKREVRLDRERKSLSVESTYHEDIVSPEIIFKKIDILYKEFRRRWEKSKLSEKKIKTFIIKVKFYDFKQTTHEKFITYLPQANEFKHLFSEIEQSSKPIRLLGLGVKLKTQKREKVNSNQLSLFSDI